MREFPRFSFELRHPFFYFQYLLLNPPLSLNYYFSTRRGKLLDFLSRKLRSKRDYEDVLGSPEAAEAFAKKENLPESQVDLLIKMQVRAPPPRTQTAPPSTATTQIY